ncbi:flagellar protein FliT [Paenibacillus thiaminolyticus]|uniref:flagellar protein FliT n=1 Tax=Paenibacillus thiaminolyticus TaxID=49283 RepID=UPI001164D10A|nr:flagellar protein FliT [Paenibacillus thiaminolyticus]NGP58752.1 flagellar protein FliT [Paenibacillus thiaminolyticus]WCR26226.1 flagellar protein FliT [Paenibacillus thiaminolyticus]
MHDIRKRIATYDEMIDLCQQYILEIKEREWQDSSFLHFTEKWDQLKEYISSGDTEMLTEEERNQEAIRCQTLQVLYQSIIDRIERQISQLGSQVQGVRQSKTIMNAYQGMGRIDQVAYYFDEKK